MENNCPIAIVGMACRFPKADNLQEFWELLKNGQDSVSEIPKERWNIEDYYDSDAAAARKTNQRHAAMLKDIHHFDPFFFNISPTEATEMNPSQKLMLELAWETFENSSIPFQQIQGEKVGVYIGNIWSDFEHLRKQRNSPVTSHSAVGQSSNIIANRVSFTYGLRGPSLVLDTGCSSSLVAIHLACQSLWDGSTKMALAGAVNHILDPDQYILLTKFGGLSKTGKCRTFDKDADGFVRGEGAGLLLLKKLSEAEKDGDQIYAVIRGSAVNNNGYNANLPATSVEGQKEALTEAYRMAGIAPKDVHYVEAHGTGTRLGDPTESRALGEFFGKNRYRQLHVGSVKTNIGHLEGAAGIAGLIKVVLSMRHRMLPPSLNFNTPNPDIPFDELKLRVQNTLGQWPATANDTLKAGINSFGWGGTNAHTVLEEYRDKRASTPTKPTEQQRFILPISATSEAALKVYTQKYIAHLKENVGQSLSALEELCAASAIRKPSLDYRSAFSGTSKEEIIQAMEASLEENIEAMPGRKMTTKDKIVFIFPGQGSQWLGMGKELFEREPVFKKSIEASHEAFLPYTDWTLIEQLHASSQESRLTEINVIQPVLCAVQIALAELWRSWGVIPDAVVGHSMGEVAAAYIAGAITLPDAARIICTRSRLMKVVSGKGGAMAVTELGMQDAEKLVSQYPHKLSVAVSNSPKSTVLAGDQFAIEDVLTELESKGLFAKKVKVDVASHSPQMEPLMEPLRLALQEMKPRSTRTTLYSTVKNQVMEGKEMGADYWVSNLRGTVQFASVVAQLFETKHTVFIEMSPHPVLTNAVNECAEFHQAKSCVIPSVFREKPEQSTIYQHFADLYTRGYALNWAKFYPSPVKGEVSLPSYPFQREKYEIEDRSSERQDRRGQASSHPLLGHELSLAETGRTRYWESEISTGDLPFLNDHQVNETPVFPGAGYLEIALAACDEVWGKGNHLIENFIFHKPIIFQGQSSFHLQIKVTLVDERQATLQFFQKPVNHEPWLLLAEGTAQCNPAQDERDSHEHPSLQQFKSGHRTEGRIYYQQLKTLGLHYGTYFQGIEELWTQSHTQGTEVLVKLKPDARLAQMAGQYRIHPALSDSSFQAIFAGITGGNEPSSEKTTFLTSVGSFRLLQDSVEWDDLWVYAKLSTGEKDPKKGTVEVSADIKLFTPGGKAVMQVTGLKGKVLDTRMIREQQGELKSWLYKNTWLEQMPIVPKKAPAHIGCWLILGDDSGISGTLSSQFKKAGIEYVHVAYDGHYEQVKSSSWDHDEIHYRINYAKPAHYQQLFQSLLLDEKKKIAGIVHCSSTYTHWSVSEASADEMESLQKMGSMALTYLLQSLATFQIPHSPILAVVTNGVQHIGGETMPANVVHAPLWGLARVVANELSSYSCRRFDLSFKTTAEEVNILFGELLRDDHTEDETVIRGKKRYVSRLDNHQEENYDWEEASFSPDGTYMVTGFRGLGFCFIEWMFEKGARNFSLLSRTGQVSAEVTEKMAALKTRGAHFRLAEVDVSDYAQLKAAMADLDAHMPPLKGVIHAAGLIEAKPLLDHSWDSFTQILAPKVKGAWNLHMLTQDKSLDCFVLFSSASSLIGLSGQSSYVAANAFLDSLAHHRKHKGLPAISINWGVMKDVGMVANAPEMEKYARAEGFEAVRMTEAMEVFGKIYSKGYAQMGIMKLDAVQCASYHSALARTGYLSNLLQPSKATGPQEGDFLEALSRAVTKEEQLQVMEQQLLKQVAKIIKAPLSKINNSMTFKGLGIDSLMAVQLRNQLEKIFHCKLSVTTFWMHPTIREYAVLLQEMSKSESSTATPIDIMVGDWFVIPAPNPKATIRLFCFHDAGGSSMLYQGWEQYLDATTELVLVELPGRGRRVKEQAYTDMKSFVKDFVPMLAAKSDKPFVFFGHSMGGAFLFEVTRELRKQNLPMPVKLFVSSTPWLGSYDKEQVDYQLSEMELIQRFPHLSHERIADMELQQLLVTMLRSDLQLLTNYHYQADAVFNIPIIALHGDQDARVKAAHLAGWQTETQESFQLITRNGGHRYIEHDAPFLAQLVNKELIKCADVPMIDYQPII
ncbi:MAG: SDR family oxidoreductase [Bacteroidota bacterium]